MICNNEKNNIIQFPIKNTYSSKDLNCFKNISDSSDKYKNNITYEFAFNNIDLDIIEKSLHDFISIVEKALEIDEGNEDALLDYYNYSCLQEYISKYCQYNKLQKTYTSLIKLTYKEIMLLLNVIETEISFIPLLNEDIKMWSYNDFPYLFSIYERLSGFLSGFSIIEKNKKMN